MGTRLRLKASARWDDADLGRLRQIVGSNLEVVDASSLQLDPNSGEAAAQP
jgi:hypothetical protein